MMRSIHLALVPAAELHMVGNESSHAAQHIRSVC